jgi:hypothetical protein
MKLISRWYEQNLYKVFEVLTAVVTKVSIFWDIASYNPYMNQHFGRTYHPHLQGRKSAEQETSMITGG